MQCYSQYTLFSLPELLFPLKSSILRQFSDLSRQKVVNEKGDLETGFAILVSKVS